MDYFLLKKNQKKYIKGYDVFTTKWNVIGEKNFIQLMLLDKYYEYKLGILDNCDRREKKEKNFIGRKPFKIDFKR